MKFKKNFILLIMLAIVRRPYIGNYQSLENSGDEHTVASL